MSKVEFKAPLEMINNLARDRSSGSRSSGSNGYDTPTDDDSSSSGSSPSSRSEEGEEVVAMAMEMMTPMVLGVPRFDVERKVAASTRLRLRR